MLQRFGQFMLSNPTRRLAVMAAILLCGLAVQGELMASDRLLNESVVVIGASYAGGWPVESIGGCRWSTRASAARRATRCWPGSLTTWWPRDPRYVLIWGFINDVFRTDLDQAEVRLERSREDYRRMIELAREAGIRPVLVTEITMAKSPGLVNALRYWFDGLRGKASYAERVNRHVMAMNAWIREHAAANDIPVLDFEAVFADSDGWRRPAFATEDGSHVTAEGYAALSAYVEQQWPELALARERVPETVRGALRRHAVRRAWRAGARAFLAHAAPGRGARDPRGGHLPRVRQRPGGPLAPQGAGVSLPGRPRAAGARSHRGAGGLGYSRPYTTVIGQASRHALPRVTEAVYLARKHPGARVTVTGAGTSPGVMAEIIEALGWRETASGWMSHRRAPTRARCTWKLN
jgi:lysophospholipase L1-like esterase